MFTSPKPFKSKPVSKKTQVRNSSSLKNALFFTSLIGLSLVIFHIPLIEFLKSDFNYFSKLTAQTYPHLQNNFHREFITQLTLISMLIFAMTSLTFFYAHRFFSNQQILLNHVTEHLHKLQEGAFHTKSLSTLSQNEGLEDLTQALDHLQISLLESTQEDLKTLESLNVDIHDLTSRSLIDKMIENKRKQLGRPSNVENVLEFRRTPKEKKSA